jgi:hypothetical protein
MRTVILLHSIVLALCSATDTYIQNRDTEGYGKGGQRHHNSSQVRSESWRGSRRSNDQLSTDPRRCTNDWIHKVRGQLQGTLCWIPYRSLPRGPLTWVM